MNVSTARGDEIVAEKKYPQVPQITPIKKQEQYQLGNTGKGIATFLC
jgi:hypothetical protein